MATYYVAANGSDAADGLTTGTAWQTITKVNSTAFVAGDVIRFRGGDTFTGPLVIDNDGASLANPIRFTTYGSGRALINGAASRSVHFNGSSFTIIENLECYGSTNDSNIFVDGTSTDNVIRNCKSRNATQQGILTIALRTHVLNNELHNNGTTSQHHGVYCGSFEASFSHDWLVEGNECYGNGGAGIHCYLTGGGIVQRNKCYNNAAWGIIISNIGTPVTAIVRGNLCYGNQIGIELENIVSGSVVECFRNTCINNTVVGIFGESNTVAGNVRIRGNMVAFNGTYNIALASPFTPYSPLTHNCVWRTDAGLTLAANVNYTQAELQAAVGVSGGADAWQAFDPLLLSTTSGKVGKKSPNVNWLNFSTGLTQDLEGQPVSGTGNEDIGCYEVNNKDGKVGQI